MDAVQFFHESTRMSQAAIDIENFKVYINDVVVWTELFSNCHDRTKGKPYVVKRVSPYGTITIINDLGREGNYGRAHGFKVLHSRHFSVKSDAYIDTKTNELLYYSSKYSVGLLFSNKELKYLNNPVNGMGLTNAVSAISTTEDTKLFKVYKDSATRKLKIGDVVVWTGLGFRHNSLTRNKPYVVVNTAYSIPEICVADNSGDTNYYGRGAGFKVIVTKEIKDSNTFDICITNDNSLYLADDLSWLSSSSTDKVLVLSDKQTQKRRFKNSKITILKDTADGYDFV